MTRASIEWILGKQGTGNAVVIVIGGAAEALEAHPGNYNLTLKNRMGFVKLAIKYGYDFLYSFLVLNHLLINILNTFDFIFMLEYQLLVSQIY